jgi:hypothetical protein
MYLKRLDSISLLIVCACIAVSSCGGKKNHPSNATPPGIPIAGPLSSPTSTPAPVPKPSNDPYVKENTYAACTALGNGWSYLNVSSFGKYLCIKNPVLKRTDENKALTLVPDGEPIKLEIVEEAARALTLSAKLDYASSDCFGTTVKSEGSAVLIIPRQLSTYKSYTSWPIKCVVSVQGQTYEARSQALKIDFKIEATPQQRCELQGLVWKEGECRPIPRLGSGLASAEKLTQQVLRVGDKLKAIELNLYRASESEDMEAVVVDESCPGVIKAWMEPKYDYNYLKAAAQVEPNFDLSGATEKMCEGKIKIKQKGVLSAQSFTMKVTIKAGRAFYGSCQAADLTPEAAEAVRLIRADTEFKDKSCDEVAALLKSRSSLRIEGDAVHVNNGLAADFSALAFENQLESLEFKNVNISGATALQSLKSLTKLSFINSHVDGLDWIDAAQLETFIFCGGKTPPEKESSVMAALQDATQLKSLSLGVYPASLWGFQACSGTPDFLLQNINFNSFSKLQTLRISQQRTNSQLKLENLPELKELLIGTTNFDGIDLKDLTKLERFTLSAGTVKKVRLENLPALTSLVLDTVGSDEDDDISISQLEKLKSLTLNIPGKKRFSLHKLQGLPKLEQLSIAKGLVDASWQEALEQLYQGEPSKLTSLEISLNAIPSFLGHHPNLVSLSLAFPESMSLADLKSIPATIKAFDLKGGKDLNLELLKTIKSSGLSLSNVTFSASSRPALIDVIEAALSDNTNLQQIKLTNLQLSESGREKLVLENLGSLTSFSCSGLTALRLPWLKQFSRLTSFDWNNSPVSAALLNDIGSVASLARLGLNADETLAARDRALPSLEGIATLSHLDSLYVTGHVVTSLAPVAALMNLTRLYADMELIGKDEASCPVSSGPEILRKQCHRHLYGYLSGL